MISVKGRKGEKMIKGKREGKKKWRDEGGSNGGRMAWLRVIKKNNGQNNRQQSYISCCLLLLFAWVLFF